MCTYTHTYTYIYVCYYIYMTDICMSCCNINPDNYACVTEKKKKNQTKNEKNMKKETMII